VKTIPLALSLALVLATPVAAEQAQPTPDPQLAWLNCIKRAFSPGGNAALKQAFDACASEEADYLIALVGMMLIPHDFLGADTDLADEATLDAQGIIYRQKLRMARDAVKRLTPLPPSDPRR
jgi:hypothetical protein